MMNSATARLPSAGVRNASSVASARRFEQFPRSIDASSRNQRRVERSCAVGSEQRLKKAVISSRSSGAASVESRRSFWRLALHTCGKNPAEPDQRQLGSFHSPGLVGDSAKS